MSSLGITAFSGCTDGAPASPAYFNAKFSEVYTSLTAVAAALPSFSANDYGAVAGGNSSTNRTAFLAAMTAAMNAGGGRITATPGTYQITGSTTVSLPVPVNGANYTTTAQNMSAHFYLLEPTGLHFDMPGVTLESTESGFQMFLLNGPRDCTFNVGRYVSPTVNTAGTITTAGIIAIAVTTTTRDGWGLRVPFMHVDHCYVSLYIFGDAAGSYRMRGVQVGAVYHETGEYGIALHNNGDDVVVDSLVTNEVGRPIFAYGVDGVKANVHNRAQLGGLHMLLKAYDRDLRNIDITYRIVTGNASVPGLAMESEHHPATQPTPAVLRNIRIRYDDEGSFGGNKGIEFDYKQDGVSTPTCSTTLFDGITLSGSMDNSGLASLVQQSPLGLLNTDGLLKSGARVSNAIYSTGGFYTLVGGCVSIPAVGTGFQLQADTTTDGTQYGQIGDHRVSSAATILAVGKYLRSGTVAGGFSTLNLQTLRLANPVVGSGSTITNATALFIEDVTSGISSNLVIDSVGTAPSRFSGRVDATAFGFRSETSLHWTRSGVSTIAPSYGTLNLALNGVRLSVRSLDMGSLTSANVAVNEICFAIGASGCSLALRSNGTMWYPNSSLSTVG